MPARQATGPKRRRVSSLDRVREATGTPPVTGAPGRAGRQEPRRAAVGRAPAPWHYAKHVSAYLDPAADQRVSRRHIRYGQREVLWRESTIERVRKCGRVAIGDGGNVLIRDNGGVAHYTGLATCGSIWACPCCSAKIRNTRAGDISAAAGAWDKQGNSVYMITLTVPHDMGMRLAQLLPVIADGFRAVISGRPWVKLRKRLGIVGSIRSVEITYGEHGWHPHLHVLMFIGGDLDARGLADFHLYMRDRWARWVVKAGYRLPHNEHGVKIDRCTSAEEAGLYIAKTQDGRAVGNEMARGDMKQGRLGGRTPFEILDDFRWSGDVADLALWREYERATRGRQAITWSNGLRALLIPDAPEEASDDEVAAAEIGGEDLAVIHGDTWRDIIRVPGLPAYLLDQAEAGGVTAVNAALAAHGMGSVLPPSSLGSITLETSPDGAQYWAGL
jgi:hypothetical protein